MALENIDPKATETNPEVKEQPADSKVEPTQDAPAKQESADQKPEEQKEKKLSETEQLQQLMTDYVKLKKAFDATASEAADYKRKYKATLDEKQVASMEKAEAEAKRDAELAEYKRRDMIHELTEQFMDLGYSKESAKKAAVARADGDKTTEFNIQKAENARMIAEKEAEWLKSRPQVQQSSDEAETDPFLLGFNSVKSPY
jgi:hypothetical protein